jgi:hypothetical protein
MAQNFGVIQTVCSAPLNGFGAHLCGDSSTHVESQFIGVWNDNKYPGHDFTPIVL